jgi:uncharacterized protein YunC (DUF1805 family)
MNNCYNTYLYCGRVKCRVMAADKILEFAARHEGVEKVDENGKAK